MKTIITLIITLLSIDQIFCADPPSTIPENLIKQVSSIQFIENKGQIIDKNGNYLNDVLFRAEIPGAIVYITTKGLSYFFYEYDHSYDPSINDDQYFNDTVSVTTRFQRIDMHLLNCEIKNVNIIQEGESLDYSNYYYGRRPGVLNVHSYEKIIIKNIYPGIDWVLYSVADNKNMFKQDFIVNPGADPNSIKIKYSGPLDMHIYAKENEISVSTALGEIRETDLIGYSGNEKIDIDYLFNNNIAGFLINDDYDVDQPLIIDPAVLVWCTYFGGPDIDWCYDIKSNGSKIIVGGYTWGDGLPLFDPGNGAYFDSIADVDFTPFVILFDSTGERLWATYLSGDDGSGDFLNAVAINNKEIFITGRTNSTTFPVLNAGGSSYFDDTKNLKSDFFISKFDLGGVMLWSTYFGGNDLDYASDIYCDEEKVWVTGSTFSDSLFTIVPMAGSYMQTERAGNFDAFFMQFNVSGQLIWSTYFGGIKEDLSNTLSGNGNDIWIAGSTKSSDLPLYDSGGAAYFDSLYSDNGVPDLLREPDVFLTRFDTAGVLKWSTYLGGDSIEYDDDIFVDDEQVLLSGSTTSENFPVVYPGAGAFMDSLYIQEEGFITQFNLTNELLWSTYFGNDNDGADPHSIVAHEGNIYLTGEVSVYDAAWHLFDAGDGSYFDSTTLYTFHGFITKFNQERKIVWSTFFIQSALYLSSFIDVDDNAIWLAGTIITPDECLFPATNPGGSAYFNSDGGNENEIFIAKFSNCFVNVDVSQTGNVLEAEFLSASYQWIDCLTGDIIFGATEKQFIPTLSGSYAVIVTKGSCSDTSNCFDVFINEIGTPENDLFSFYPNPTASDLFIQSKGSGNSEILIYDIYGQVLLKQLINSEILMKLDVSNYSPGNYLIKFTNENGDTGTKKFSKI